VGDLSAARPALFEHAAAQYSELGWALTPTRGKVAGNGWDRAAPEAAELAAGKWSRWGADRNIAVVAGPSGLAIVDVDSDQGEQTLARVLAGEPLPATPTVRTGRGRHLYFADPGGLRPRVGEGLDLRAGPSYVVAPPSEHPDTGKRYSWDGPPPWQLAPATMPGRLREHFAAAGGNGAPPERVADMIPQGRRRDALLSLAGSMRRRGMTGPEILAGIAAVNAARCQPPLEQAELEQLAGDVERRYRPDPAAALPTVPAATPGAIGDVLEVFRRWLHLPDPAPVLVTCAVIAANRVESFDPSWLILVGAAGSGKTESLAATSRLDGVHVVATLTEAALLSGTPRKEAASGASGGLLREIGESGVIILKDFGSILSMHRDARERARRVARTVRRKLDAADR
jgi:hypothetical protein